MPFKSDSITVIDVTPGTFCLPELLHVTSEGYGEPVHPDDATLEDIYEQFLALLRFRREVNEGIDQLAIRLERQMRSMKRSIEVAS
jgi:hypothetical protein